MMSIEFGLNQFLYPTRYRSVWQSNSKTTTRQLASMLVCYSWKKKKSFHGR